MMVLLLDSVHPAPPAAGIIRRCSRVWARRLVAPVLLLLLALPGYGVGEPPASQPRRSYDSIRTWYLQLADPDPQLREQARIELMGISRQDLTQLEQIVAQNRPVQASQAAVLQDIVMHVYMAGEPYPAAESWGGFLGVRWEPGERETWTDPPGIIISQRIPGFTAYRMLRQGDVIVGIEQMPGLTFNDRGDLTNALRDVPGGTTLNFLVLRGGGVQKVPIRLDSRPVAAVQGQPVEAMAMLESNRQMKAEEYWSRAFAPLVQDHSVSILPP